MNGGLIHNKKFNLVAFLSMGLFLLIGFIDIFSWIFIMLPVVVCFYVYDIRPVSYTHLTLPTKLEV